ncbi:MAG: acetyl-CoA carboxylase, carboxyltransferase subunit beta [Candidatus Marinimicrobia bacterium]|nr:acetyl-CoA carboxylase, carboxyltransferase subunit beta [Candidatus Neomarinimicrobiota bacterium]
MGSIIPNHIKKIFKFKIKESEINVDEKAFLQCPQCRSMIYQKDIDKNFGICPECEHHFRISNKEWENILLDEENRTKLFEEYKADNILKFPGYNDKLKSLKRKDINEAISIIEAKINGIKVLVGIMNAEYIMASMGAVVGERITLMFEKGAKENLPVIIITRSGGARMQEGIISLMQMVKTSASIKRFSDSGNLYTAVLTNPTTGGVTASFAMLGDIIIAEPEALIGFAGPRVIQQTIKQTLPKGFQRSEFLVEKGFVDLIIKRNNLKSKLTEILKIHNYK